MTLARGKHANLSKMSPLERGKTLVKTSTEYIVFGDFVCLEPYVFAMTAYWVPLATKHDRQGRDAHEGRA